MAADQPTTTRRALLGAAAALPVVPFTAIPGARLIRSRARALWERRLARLDNLTARMKAAEALGPYRHAVDRYERAGDVRLSDSAWKRLSEAEDAQARDHDIPLLQAAVLLALTPSPDLGALFLKIQVVREHELDSYEGLPRPALQILQEDVQRIAATGGNPKKPELAQGWMPDEDSNLD